MRQQLLFARNFFRYPRMLGWFLPSSHFLVEGVLKRVDWPRAKVIVEYGPGLGAFTKEILRRMRPDAVLLAVETNGDFVQLLNESLRDRRLRVLHRSAEEIDKVLAELGLPCADYVISGIPFTMLPAAVRDRIIRKTHFVLNPKGAFLLYQFTRAALPHLQRVFPRVDHDFELLNILPAQLFHCVR